MFIWYGLRNFKKIEIEHVFQYIALFDLLSRNLHTSRLSTFRKTYLQKRLLWGGENLNFGCFCRSLSLSSTWEENNASLNYFLCYVSGKRYSHHCCLGDFNFRNINWSMLTYRTIKKVTHNLSRLSTISVFICTY